MLKAVLFDLDGTLLPIDTDDFLKYYLRLLAAKVASQMEPQLFIKHLMAATNAMIINTDSTKTNESVFVEDFFARTGLDHEVMMPLFEEFYLNEYCQLEAVCLTNSIVPDIVKKTVKHGYQTVIATNPVFPRIAIEERLRWAGVENYFFDLITAYENMHFCKPQVQYYREIIEMLGVKPEECLMVGNDAEEDLVAQKAGMKTFLVDTHLINRGQVAIKTDYQGSLDDFLNLIEILSKHG